MIQIFLGTANDSIFLQEGTCSKFLCEKENDKNLLGETKLERVDFDGSLAKVIFVASNNSSFKCSQFRTSKNQIIWKVGSFRIWNGWLWMIEKYVLHLYKIGGLLPNSSIVSKHLSSFILDLLSWHFQLIMVLANVYSQDFFSSDFPKYFHPWFEEIFQFKLAGDWKNTPGRVSEPLIKTSNILFEDVVPRIPVT